ncbi:MAG: 30S ribosome-binding factor RbfA [Flavobacteriaceae bacterium]|jgi:ribosome-binding factor A|nr:30S ribosome-binding factor RbfA [Flavobacteriales bacterium]MDG1272108.1 30S ribosome-binding factor RbfA [Flavobacteriaceae bacterium]
MQEQSPRQQKIGTLLQKEVAQLLQSAVRQEGISNLILSVTKVRVTVDLSLAKVYLSIFPSEKADFYLNALQQNSFQLKHDLSQLLKNQLRRIPELVFYLDDSLDYIEAIEKDLTRPDNPIEPNQPPKAD